MLRGRKPATKKSPRVDSRGDVKGRTTDLPAGFASRFGAKQGLFDRRLLAGTGTGRLAFVGCARRTGGLSRGALCAASGFILGILCVTGLPRGGECGEYYR